MIRWLRRRRRQDITKLVMSLEPSASIRTAHIDGGGRLTVSGPDGKVIMTIGQGPEPEYQI